MRQGRTAVADVALRGHTAGAGIRRRGGLDAGLLYDGGLVGAGRAYDHAVRSEENVVLVGTPAVPRVLVELALRVRGAARLACGSPLVVLHVVHVGSADIDATVVAKVIGACAFRMHCENCASRVNASRNACTTYSTRHTCSL